MATIYFTNNSDSGAGSLRAAIGSASSGDIIAPDPNIFTSGSTIEISLSNHINITNKTLTIDAGENHLKLNAQGLSAIFYFTYGVTCEINNVIITNGSRTYGAGVIVNIDDAHEDYESNITFNRCIIAGNNATTNGSALFASKSSTLTLNDCVICDNKSPAALAWLGSGSETYVNRCTIIGNYSTSDNDGYDNTLAGDGDRYITDTLTDVSISNFINVPKFTSLDDWTYSAWESWNLKLCSTSDYIHGSTTGTGHADVYGTTRVANGALGAVEYQKVVSYFTNNSDSGTGSLRSVISSASVGSVIEPDPDVFESGTTITISLASSIEIKNKNLTLDSGTCRIRLNGQNNIRCVFISNNSVHFTGFDFIYGNASTNGGGVSAYNTESDKKNLKFHGCFFAGNYSVNSGSAAYADVNIIADLVDCVVANNYAAKGALDCNASSSAFNITRSTLIGNFSEELTTGYRSIRISNGNSTATDSLIDGTYSSSYPVLANSHKDVSVSEFINVPEFTSLDAWTSDAWQTWNLSLSSTSDYIEGATTSSGNKDFSGNARKTSGALGAYEYQKTVTYFTNSSDSGSGSLRNAISSATAGSVIEPDPSVFKPGSIITIPIGSQLAINGKRLSIDGGKCRIRFDGQGLYRGVNTQNSGIGKLCNVDILNCFNSSNGGGTAVSTSSTLKMYRCLIAGCNSSNSGSAAAVFVGTLSLNSCVIVGNIANRGAVDATTATGTHLIVNNCTIVGNITRSSSVNYFNRLSFETAEANNSLLDYVLGANSVTLNNSYQGTPSEFGFVSISSIQSDTNWTSDIWEDYCVKLTSTSDYKSGSTNNTILDVVGNLRVSGGAIGAYETNDSGKSYFYNNGSNGVGTLKEAIISSSNEDSVEPKSEYFDKNKEYTINIFKPIAINSKQLNIDFSGYKIKLSTDSTALGSNTIDSFFTINSSIVTFESIKFYNTKFNNSCISVTGSSEVDFNWCEFGLIDNSSSTKASCIEIANSTVNLNYCSIYGSGNSAVVYACVNVTGTSVLNIVSSDIYANFTQNGVIYDSSTVTCNVKCSTIVGNCTAYNTSPSTVSSFREIYANFSTSLIDKINDKTNCTIINCAENVGLDDFGFVSTPTGYSYSNELPEHYDEFDLDITSSSSYKNTNESNDYIARCDIKGLARKKSGALGAHEFYGASNVLYWIGLDSSGNPVSTIDFTSADGWATSKDAVVGGTTVPTSSHDLFIDNVDSSIIGGTVNSVLIGRNANLTSVTNITANILSIGLDSKLETTNITVTDVYLAPYDNAYKLVLNGSNCAIGNTSGHGIQATQYESVNHINGVVNYIGDITIDSMIPFTAGKVNYNGKLTSTNGFTLDSNRSIAAYGGIESSGDITITSGSSLEINTSCDVSKIVNNTGGTLIIGNNLGDSVKIDELSCNGTLSFLGTSYDFTGVDWNIPGEVNLSINDASISGSLTTGGNIVANDISCPEISCANITISSSGSLTSDSVTCTNAYFNSATVNIGSLSVGRNMSVSGGDVSITSNFECYSKPNIAGTVTLGENVDIDLPGFVVEEDGILNSSIDNMQFDELQVETGGEVNFINNLTEIQSVENDGAINISSVLAIESLENNGEINLSGTDTILRATSEYTGTGSVNAVGTGARGYFAIPTIEEVNHDGDLRVCQYGAGISRFSISEESGSVSLSVTSLDSSKKILAENLTGGGNVLLGNVDQDTGFVLIGDPVIVRVFDGVNFFSSSTVAQVTGGQIFYVYRSSNYCFNNQVKPYRYDNIVFLAQITNEADGTLLTNNDVTSAHVTLLKKRGSVGGNASYSEVNGWTNVEIDTRCVLNEPKVYDVWEEDSTGANFIWIPNQDEIPFVENSGEYIAQFRMDLTNNRPQAVVSATFEVL